MRLGGNKYIILFRTRITGLEGRQRRKRGSLQMDQKTTLLRSWMFVPGDRQRMIDKALSLSVDAIMMDIEDGVAPSEKENARVQIGAALDDVAARLVEDPQLRTPARFVRVNVFASQPFIQATN